MDETGYNVEEIKLIDETRKIFAAPEIAIAPTCIRVPVVRKRPHRNARDRIHQPNVTCIGQGPRNLLAAAPGLRIVDDPAHNRFPTPLEATGIDEVLVGRIRQDPTIPDGRPRPATHARPATNAAAFDWPLEQWAKREYEGQDLESIRKGAALNVPPVQIAELLL